MTFFIKVYGLKGYGKKSTLRSSKRLQEIIGEDLHDKLTSKAYSKGLDKVVTKLRRGLTIIFYSK